MLGQGQKDAPAPASSNTKKENSAQDASEPTKSPNNPGRGANKDVPDRDRGQDPGQQNSRDAVGG